MLYSIAFEGQKGEKPFFVFRRYDACQTKSLANRLQLITTRHLLERKF
jgi:hypothetical protein